LPGKIAINNLQEAREFLGTYFDFHDSEVQNIEIRFKGQVVESAKMTIIKVHGPSVDEYLQGTRHLGFVPGVRPVNRTLQIEFADVIAVTFSSSYSTHSALPGRKGTVWVIMHVFASQVDGSIKWEFDLVAENAPQNPYPVIIFGSAEVTELL